MSHENLDYLTSPDNSALNMVNSPRERHFDLEKEQDFIKVYIRIKSDTKGRSNSPQRRSSPDRGHLRILNSKTIQIKNRLEEFTKNYYFDGIFDEKAKQEDVFLSAVVPLISKALLGYNSTIFVYGQTGTGT